ncbi:hypothetical protein DESUT3_15050 [Desulfuromonas versatilis]|uniref:Uncharacterized protein n=1 Tax=Desulfuromonas versatilis TaxID=2802975 RepID=A0ABN6DZ87_9BACT|nr:hypothetical protein [Desulfuromonas versatilis]BCR04436.1 hypothetical protein DESUT3_15050 [Desulfuromonas versatilis]
MRKSTIFIYFLFLNLMLAGLAIGHSQEGRTRAEASLSHKSSLVKRLGLTDLALFTEARYTRHPAMADLGTPFQDYPMSQEHYPTGSLVGPPPHLTSQRVGP